MDQDGQPGRGGEPQPRQEHEQRADDQDTPPADAVGVGGEPERNGRVAQECQGQEHPYERSGEPEGGEVEDQHDRHEAVAEHAHRSRREDEAPIAPERHRLPRLSARFDLPSAPRVERVVGGELQGELFLVGQAEQREAVGDGEQPP